ncbi:electron transfer flavoprotein subunit beta/FixA family protein [Streptomyces acidicola]|uniref:electron transfer flavoprotein subunit beta/FixA family protein n=1 Tax=Streptomyces acidicola TaxID=2596892 RepID=UPI0037FE803E
MKQIPNPNVSVAFDEDTKRLMRTGPLVMDEADSFAVETALRLADQAGGGQVTLVSVSPDSEVDGLRAALAIGGDKAIVVSDPALAGTDALGTSKVLAAVAKRENADLVITATESTDGYTGTVPVQMAELLGYPSVSFVRSVSVNGDALEIHRQTDSGYDEIACPLPAVISVTNGVVDVRYPTFKAKMAAKKKPIEELDIESLGMDPATVGAQAARQEVLAIRGGDDETANASAAPAFALVFGANEADTKDEGNIITDDGDAHDTVIQTLQSWRAL